MQLGTEDRIGLNLYIISMTLLLVGLSGCGQNPAQDLVKGVDLMTYELNSNSHMAAIFEVDTQRTSLPAISLPLGYSPETGFSYGELSISPSAPNRSKVTLDVNLTQAAQLPPSDPWLPNELDLPISGIDPSSIISLKTSGSSKVYIAFSPESVILGTAITLREFDSLGERVGRTNLFFPFNLKDQIFGSAGIFTGSKPHTSGLGLFVDASPLLDRLNPEGLPATLTYSQLHEKPKFQSTFPRYKKVKLIRRAINKMNARKQKLHLH